MLAHGRRSSRQAAARRTREGQKRVQCSLHRCTAASPATISPTRRPPSHLHPATPRAIRRPPPYHQPSDKAYIDPRGFALAPSLPLLRRTMTFSVVFFLLVVSLATQDPDPKTVLGTTNFLRPTTRVFVPIAGCRQSSWVQGRWQG